jgi:hypothetical protein
MIIKTINQIISERQSDTFFIRFSNGITDDLYISEEHPLRQSHLAWFGSHGLQFELAAPDGLLMGDPCCYAVYFDTVDDPRITAYSAEFENSDGGSLNPEVYQMVYITYQSWLDEGGPAKLAAGLDDTDW